MGWGGVALILVGVQAISVCSLPRAAVAAAAGDGRNTNSLCDAVLCGRGTCQLNTNQTFGFVCKCEPGWTRPQIGPYFQFLPCVIPNCTLDYTCFHSAMAPSPSPTAPSPPSNLSLFDPCKWSHCGAGTCVRTSNFGHRCDCNPGFGNLLSVTNFPCFKPCVLGFDCARLGILVASGSTPSSSSASPPALSGRAPNTAITKFPGRLMWLSLLMAFLALIPRT